MPLLVIIMHLVPVVAIGCKCLRIWILGTQNTQSTVLSFIVTYMTAEAQSSI